MFAITKEEFIKYLKENHTFVLEDGTSIEAIISVQFNEEDPSVVPSYNVKGYVVDDTVEYSTLDELLSALHIQNEVKLESISGFESLEEMEEEKDFESICMKELLDRYAACDRVSLSSYADEDLHITKEEATKALDQLYASDKQFLRQYFYGYMKDTMNLSFDEVFKDIEEECAAFKAKHGQEYIRDGEDDFQYSFICDHVGEDTKYSEPSELYWHFYQMLGSELDSEKLIEKYLENSGKKSPMDIFKEYKELAASFISYEITFGNHCTGGPLYVTYYFHMDDNMKNWLLQRENDFDLEPDLEDLAFYKGDKLCFSSCTHEGYHSDCEEE